MPIGRHTDDDAGDSAVSWDDYQMMHVQTTAVRSRQRRHPTPAWALTESSTRRVVLAFMEKRAFSKKQREQLIGTDRERFLAVIQKLKSQTDARVHVIESLCNEFVSCTDPARRKTLTTEITNLDRVVQLIGRPDVFYEVVVAYHCEHLDSVGVAERCGLSPWGVRALLYRMNKVASSLGYTVEFSKPRPKPTPEQVAWAKLQRRLARAERLEVRRNRKLLGKAARDAEKLERRKRALAASPKSRAERIAAGLCSACGKTRDDDDYKLCGRCRERNRDWLQQRKQVTACG